MKDHQLLLDTTSKEPVKYNYELLQKYQDYLRKHLDFVEYEVWLEKKRTIIGKSILGETFLL